MYKWGREKQNYFPSEEKRNKNTPLIVAISFSDGLKKKKKSRASVIKSILTNAFTVQFSKKKKIIIILWNETQDVK